MFSQKCGKCELSEYQNAPCDSSQHRCCPGKTSDIWAISCISTPKKDRLRGKGPEKLPMLWHWTWDVFSPQGGKLWKVGCFCSLSPGLWTRDMGTRVHQDKIRWDEGMRKTDREEKREKGRQAERKFSPVNTHNSFPAVRTCIYPCVFGACLDSFSFCINQLKNTKWLRGQTNKFILTGAGQVTGLRLLTFFIPPFMCAGG